jgi:H+/gluconate symporter-like permease
MDAATLSLVGIIVGLIFLVALAFCGFSLLLISPLAAVLVIIVSGEDIITLLSGPYMLGFTNFAMRNYLLFLLSAIFGKLIGDCGAAKYIAHVISRLAKKYPGKEKILAVCALMLVQAVLTYGGISLFVVVFTIVSIGKNLFEELDIPWSMYTCLTLGSGCFTMTMLPGSPAIQNLIPMQYLGTTPMAAPVLGILSTILALALGVGWIVFETKQNERKGLGFLPTGAEISKVILPEEEIPQLNLFVCLLPSIVLLVVMNVMNQSPITALAVACVLTWILFYRRLPNIKKTLTEGCNNALTAIASTCAVTGFGAVVAAVSGYGLVISALDKLPGPPIVQLIVAVNLAAGVTGSASGGLGIAMESLTKRFLDTGLDPQLIHRIASMSSGGLDSLPHNGAVINTLTITRLGHRYGYKHYFVMTVIIPLICTAFAAFLGQLGIL